MIQGHFSVLTVPVRYFYFPFQDKLKSVTVFGAGLLVGTALAVIIPEGINAMYTSGGRCIYYTSTIQYMYSRSVNFYSCNVWRLKVTCIQYYLLFDDSDVNFERYELEINIMSMTHAIWIILLFQRLLQLFFYHLSSRLLYARNFPQTFKFYVLFIYTHIVSS